MSRYRGMPLAAVWIALTVAACTSPGVMSGTAMDFNETVARTADSQLLLNIVRAEHRNPTHYSAITQVRDSRSIQGAAGASGLIPFGPDASHLYSVSPSLSATGSLSPSFDVAPLDTVTAAKGLYHPIDPQIPLTYWQQNWPKKILLFLFVDDATINPALQHACNLHDPRIRNHRIDNAAYDVPQFNLVRRLFDCIAKRMYFESQDKTTKFMTNTRVPPAAVLKSLPELDKASIDVSEHTVHGHKVYSVSKTQTKLKLILKFGGQFRGRSSEVKLTSAATRAAALKNPVPAITFNIRSVDGIIYYLGELVRLQKKQQSPMTYMPVYYAGDTRPRVPQTLFDVQVAPGADPSRNITADFLGVRYAISRTPPRNDRSLTVLALLEQLFALYREEKELPKTSAVEVVGVR